METCQRTPGGFQPTERKLLPLQLSPLVASLLVPPEMIRSLLSDLCNLMLGFNNVDVMRRQAGLHTHRSFGLNFMPGALDDACFLSLSLFRPRLPAHGLMSPKSTKYCSDTALTAVPEGLFTGLTALETMYVRSMPQPSPNRSEERLQSTLSCSESAVQGRPRTIPLLLIRQRMGATRVLQFELNTFSTTSRAMLRFVRL